jgi:hypothetical protein
MEEEKLTEQEMVTVKRLAQITYEATINAIKKCEEIEKQKAASRHTKKSNRTKSL